MTKTTNTLHELSSFIDLAVFAGVAVPQAPVKYKYLEIVRNMALIQSKGDYKANIILDEHSRDLICSWVNSITFQELDHINCLELKAVLLGLKSLCRDRRDTHVRLRSDNTTVIACIDRCASTKVLLLTIVEQIFEWANMRNITLSAEYIMR